MKTRKILLTLSLAVALVAGGFVVASNMGFKFVPNFSLTGVDYWVSVPYNNNYTVANDICNDIGPNASSISKFDPATSLRSDWLCPGGPDFSIVSGEGYFMRVISATTPVFVGSHDPSLAIPQGGFTLSGVDYILSIPYHTTAAVANDLCLEVGPNASSISKFDPATSLRSDWLCPGGPDFAITIGEAYAVRVISPTAAFVPSHY